MGWGCVDYGGAGGSRHRGRGGLCCLSSKLLLFPAVEELKLDLQNLPKKKKIFLLLFLITQVKRDFIFSLLELHSFHVIIKASIY